MATWIALVRGINVGGKNILPMAKLKEDLAALGFENVQTYIQSGNVIFEARAKSASALSKRITKRIADKHGFAPAVLVFGEQDLDRAISSNPFPRGTDDPKTLHFFFLEKPASHPDLEAIEAVKSPTENYEITDDVFYLHAPDGIGRSKLAANVEKFLGVRGTGRNYRTISKIQSLIDQAQQ